MSSKSILIISSYTVSKLVRFFETQCSLYHNETTTTDRIITNEKCENFKCKKSSKHILNRVIVETISSTHQTQSQSGGCGTEVREKNCHYCPCWPITALPKAQPN